MKTFYTLLLAAFMFSPATVIAREKINNCLTQRIAIQSARVDDNPLVRKIHFLVHNRIGWTISAVQMQFELTSKDREVPWENSSLFADIPGGLQPDEQREVSFVLFYVPKDLPARDISVEVGVVNVRDAKGRLFIIHHESDRQAFGQSPHKCPR